MIEAVGLCKNFGAERAVKDVSFRVEAGEVVGFLGVNGAGKTTTMRLLTGFLPASEGHARIAGHDIFSAPRAARRAIGYLPETPPLYPEMTVRSYLRYVARLKDVPRKSVRAAVARALARTGLEAVAERVTGQLSKGFRQRVGLAQALVHDPQVLILDEPSVGLDPIQMREIRALIHELATNPPQGVARTIVLSTHLLAEVEMICDRVIVLHEGRKVLDQPLAELTRDGVRLEDVFARFALAAPAAESAA